MKHEAIWKPKTLDPQNRSGIDRAFGKSKRPVYDDADLVARLVEFVNGETDTRPSAWGYRRALGIESDQFPKMGPDGKPDFHEYDARLKKLIPREDVDALIARDKSNAQRLLHAAARDLDQLFEWLNNWRVRHGHRIGVVRRPAIRVNRGVLEIHWPLTIDADAPGGDVPNVLAYAAALFISDLNGCRTNLGYCRLPQCGRFFVVERGKPGKPRRDYCSTEHMKAAHERDSARRHKESRDRKKAEAAKGRRRRLK